MRRPKGGNIPRSVKPDGSKVWTPILAAWSPPPAWRSPRPGVDLSIAGHAQVLGDFLDYNDFLGDADALVEAMDLDGVLQVASFHPQYQFAGSEPDDADNLTNSAPYPILHLLREASIDRAVAAYPDPDAIIERNIATVRELGFAGWDKLLKSPPLGD